jgi:hypothetical protein
MTAMNRYITAVNGRAVLAHSTIKLSSKDFTREHRQRLDNYAEAAQNLDEAAILADAFANVGVAAALRDLTTVGVWHHGRLLDGSATNENQEDFETLVEDLLRLAREVSADDADSRRGATIAAGLRQLPSGHYTWLPDDNEASAAT